MTPYQEYPDLAKALDLKSGVKLYFKREDLHPLGSHKGRSIPYMIDSYIGEGKSHFAISSSGNAALAAALYIKKLNADGESLKLTILVGEHINSDKLARLEELADDSIHIVRTERPLQALFTMTKDPEVQGLRQSTDDRALAGYEALAQELLEIPDLRAIFIGTSSGTTAQALAEYFTKINNPLEVHIVQTMSCHPLSDAFENIDSTNEVSIADAIVDHTALRKTTLIPLIKKTGGRGWTVTNEIIRGAQDLTERHTDTTISPNSALSVAGIMSAGYADWKFKGSIACLITGA